MKIKLIEIAGLTPALYAVRLPYSKDPRSYRIFDTTPWWETGVIDQDETDNEHILRNSYQVHVNKEDLSLMSKLIKGGDEVGKAIRGIMVYVEITAPRYFWQEFATYRIGCECLSSSSTMHTITKGVTADMFDCDMHEAQEYYDTLQPLIDQYNKYDKELKEHTDAHTEEMVTNLKDLREMQFRRIKRHIPDCFLQTRILAVSYQTLRRIYRQRRNHRLVEWHRFCEFIEHLPFAQELIIPQKP